MIRTLFLLKYLDDPELRRTIHAATNKSEQFNDFAQWLMFGGEGVIAENVRHEQRKVIKYNHLVANMVILYNVQWMSRKLKELQEKGHPVDAEVLKVLSPYWREHINRFGDYPLDLQRPVPPLDSTIDFAFKSAAYSEMRRIFNESRLGFMSFARSSPYRTPASQLFATVSTLACSLTSSILIISLEKINICCRTNLYGNIWLLRASGHHRSFDRH